MNELCIVCLTSWCTVTTECTGDFSNFDHINYVICSWLYWFSGGLLFIIYKFLKNRYIDNKNIVLIVFLWRNRYWNWIYLEKITFFVFILSKELIFLYFYAFGTNIPICWVWSLKKEIKTCFVVKINIWWPPSYIFIIIAIKFLIWWAIRP